jgi:hypothetical protein
MTTQSIPLPTGAFQADAIRASRPDMLLARPAGFVDSETAPAWMTVTGSVLTLAGAVLTALIFAWPGDAPEIALAVPAILGVAVGLLLVMARSGVEITHDAVVLHFRPLPSRRIRRDRIVDVRLVEADHTTYGGLGLRIGRRRRALLLTPGLGIELEDDRGRVTFVRVSRPEDAFRALR